MATLAAEELAALEDAFGRLMRDRSTEAHVREVMETESGYSTELWQQLADMGITGLLVDEAHGGAGAGPVEIERLMEHAGGALLCAPLLASSVIAAGMLSACGDDDAAGRLLPEIASGERIVTALLTGPAGTWTEAGVDLAATRNGDGGWTLSGTADYVLHGRNADTWLAVARTDAGLALFELDPGASGATVAHLPSFDHTLRIDRITLSGTPAEPIGTPGDGWRAAEAALDLARVALAGEQAGGARHALDMTVEYAKLRHQFGRPIGGFQAIKHMAADLVIETESAISAARQAARALAERADDAATWVHLAAFACADAFARVTADAVQMHGGIAFTWEHPAHLYLRRARSGAQLFGTSDAYRERYLTALGG